MLEGVLMSVKTLSTAQSMAIPATVSHARTYSIAPNPAPFVDESFAASPAQLDSFLEEENPIGCIRGVMWVMAFNIGVFFLGLSIWECIKLIR
jgi:hypothetical protein